MEKKQARRIVQTAVQRLTPDARAAKSRAICERLAVLPEVRDARAMMAYLPLPDEVDLRPLLSTLLATGTRVYVPRTLPETRALLPMRLRDPARVQTGFYGIAEPDADEPADASELDIVLVPGRAFDREGNRLGRGAAYYDIFLSGPARRALRCGVAFACQMLPHVPHDARDVPMQMVVMEDETLRIAAK